MTLKEIAMFKTFLDAGGAVGAFIGLYRTRKLKENPQSIEEYLRQVDPSNVCMRAFYWVCNSTFGYDYWQHIQSNWDEFRAYDFEITDDDILELSRGAEILRRNWDSQKYFRDESKVEAAARLGIKLPRHVVKKIVEEYRRSAVNGKPRDMAEALMLEYENEAERIINNKCNNDDVALEDFEDVIVKAKSSLRRRLLDNELSLNMRDSRGRITINMFVSEEMSKRGGYEYAALKCNKQGDVILFFNDDDGVPVQDKKTHDGRVANVTIGITSFCEKLHTLLNISSEFEILKMKEVAKTSDYVAYLITKN